jgi:hypothetical protein
MRVVLLKIYEWYFLKMSISSQKTKKDCGNVPD